MIGFLKKEATFSIAFIVTLISVFLFPLEPSGYVQAVDFRILGLLFSLMAISSGLRENGFFSSIAEIVTSCSCRMRSISMMLVFIVFISSMLVTNDVALIIFVPFAISLLSGRMSGRNLALLLVLMTVAANLGSMATPVGNPQNLFLYSYFNIGYLEFSLLIVPLVLASAILVAFLVMLLIRNEDEIHVEGQKGGVGRENYVLLCLLVVAILSVLRVLDWKILLVLTVFYMLLRNRSLFLKVDYFLLLTFVCFFIFSKTLGSVDVLRRFLVSLMEQNALLTSVLSSQVISNVPTAVLLAPFTSDYRALLVGVDIGGLGTPVASLASLISLKFYFQLKQCDKRFFLISFLGINLVLLIILYMLSLLVI